MLLDFTKEEREILAEVDACIDIPRNTPERVVRKLHANFKKLIAQMRTLAPVLEARGLGVQRVTKRQSISAAVALLKHYKVAAEDLAPRRRVYKNDVAALEDACLQLRSAVVAREIAASVRNEDGGQPSDPTQSLRKRKGLFNLGDKNMSDDDNVDDFDFDNADDWDEDEHDRCSVYHLQRAQACDEAGNGYDRDIHFDAAQKHIKAMGGDPDDSERARAASRLIRGLVNDGQMS
jgi:hypothetical protein